MDRLDTQSWYRPPSSGSAKNTKPDVLIARFGKGYEQRSADGPAGAILPDWPLTWANLPRSVGLQYDSFFKTQAGWQKFEWLPPDGTSTPLQYICEEWSVRFEGAVATVTATLMQRPA